MLWSLPPQPHTLSAFSILLTSSAEGLRLCQGEHAPSSAPGPAVPNGLCWSVPLGNQPGKNYFGQFSSGKRSGLGQLSSPGKVYTGNFLDGHRHGLALQYSVSPSSPTSPISIHFGYFMGGLLEGIGEEQTVQNKLWGMFRGGLLQGKGGKESIDGRKYIGSWEKGLEHGVGEEVSQDYRYVGGWRNGVKEGMGLEESHSTTRLGALQQKKSAIPAALRELSSEVQAGRVEYLGGFQGGLWTGVGQLSLAALNGGSLDKVYVGEFAAGRLEGFGRMTQGGQYCYMGYWSGDFREGIGYEKANNEVYLGEWRNDKRNGIGYLMKGDLEYKGEFEDGMMHGVGMIKTNQDERIVRASKGQLKTEVTHSISVAHIQHFFESLSPETYFTSSRSRIAAFTQEIKEVSVIVSNVHLSCQFDFDEELKEARESFRGLTAKLSRLEMNWRQNRRVLLDQYKHKVSLPAELQEYLVDHPEILRPIDCSHDLMEGRERPSTSLFSGRTRTALLGQMRESDCIVERLNLSPSQTNLEMTMNDISQDRIRQIPQDIHSKTEPKQRRGIRSPSRSSEWRVSVQFEPDYSQARNTDDLNRETSSLRMQHSESYGGPKWRELNTKSKENQPIEAFSSFKDRTHLPQNSLTPSGAENPQPTQEFPLFRGKVPALEMQHLNKFPMFQDSSSSDNHMLSFREELSSIKYYQQQATSQTHSPERKHSTRPSKEDMMTQLSHLEDFMELPSVRTEESSRLMEDRIPQEFNSFNKPLLVEDSARDNTISNTISKQIEKGDIESPDERETLRDIKVQYLGVREHSKNTRQSSFGDIDTEDRGN